MLGRTAAKSGTGGAIAVAALLLAGCGSSGGDTAGSAVDPSDFASAIDNRYLPFEPGRSLRSRGVAENGQTPQLDVETVTHRTKRILGVRCRVVRDTVSSRGKPVERTYDWYAQDRSGNVWYFGEDARDFEHGHYVKASDSWQAGVDGARPGIVMEAHPRPGDSYRQEFYPGHALDRARVAGVLGHLRTPYRNYSGVLVTDERSALEPGVVERKFNAPGVGVVAERVVKGNRESFELVGARR